MTPLQIGRLAAVTLPLLGGCATYLDAKSNVAPGGKQERDIAAAKADLSAAKADNVRLGDEKLQRERELKRNDERIRAVQADLRKQEEALAAARKSKQVSDARYAELKRQMDALRAETQQVELQNNADALSKTPDRKADDAKAAKLADLEKRKKALETELARIAGG